MKNLFIFLFLGVLVLAPLFAFSGNSSSFFSENKFDFGLISGQPTNSTSYSMRISGGNQPIGQYQNSLRVGRFGILQYDFAVAVCGNGIVDLGEACDSGGSNGVVCSPACESSCSYCTNSCTLSSATGGACGGGDDGGGGGGGGPGGGGDCTNECSLLGSTQTACVDSTHSQVRTCGNFDADSCREWGSWNATSCDSGLVCSDGQCSATCISNCNVGDQVTTCLNSSVSQTSTCQEVVSGCFQLQTSVITACESGYCIGGSCSACKPDLQCEPWGACSAAYSFGSAVGGNQSVGFQERSCLDLNHCGGDPTERRSCDPSIPITTRPIELCNQTYLEVIDESTNEVIGRVRQTEITGLSLSRVDILFSAFGDTNKYCDYCYDRIKNFDEEDIDCGGPTCRSCAAVYGFFDWVFWVVVLLWLNIFLLLLLLSIVRRESVANFFENILAHLRAFFAKAKFGTSDEAAFEYRIRTFFRRLWRLDFSEHAPKAVKSRKVSVSTKRSIFARMRERFFTTPKSKYVKEKRFFTSVKKGEEESGRTKGKLKDEFS